MVEVPGIEPGSLGYILKASTDIVYFLSLTACHSNKQD